MKFTPHLLITLFSVAICLWAICAPLQYRTPFYESNQEYLNKSGKETLWCLAGIGFVKGASDIIEGSTIGVNFGVKGELEIGDMAQPALDVVTVIWETMLIVASYIATLQLLTQIVPAIIFWLAIAYLALLLITQLCNMVSNHTKLTLPRLRFIRLQRLLCIAIILLQIIIPFTLRINAFISSHALDNVRQEQNQSLEQIKESFNQIAQRIQQDKKELMDASFWKESGRALLQCGEELTQYAINAIAICIVEGLLLPLTSLLFMAWLCKSYFMPFIQNEPKA